MILTEKLRPRNYDDIIGNKRIVEQVREIASRDGEIPNLLFVGPPGTGKTTLALIVASDRLGIEIGMKHNNVPGFYEYNASSSRGIDFVREDLNTVAKVQSDRVIFMDEADKLTRDAWDAMRRIMEVNHHADFIFSGNYLRKIKPAILSRCSCFEFEYPPVSETAEALCTSLEREGINFPKDLMEETVEFYNGDVRRILNDAVEKVRHLDEITRDDIPWVSKKDKYDKLLSYILKRDRREGFLNFVKSNRRISINHRYLLKRIFKKLDYKNPEVFAKIDHNLVVGCDPVVQFGYLFSVI